MIAIARACPDGFFRFSCPADDCGKSMKTAAAPGADTRATCPRCRTRFEVRLEGAPEPLSLDDELEPLDEGPELPPAEPDEERAPERGRGRRWVVGAVVLFAFACVGVGAFALTRDPKPAASAAGELTAAVPESGSGAAPQQPGAPAPKPTPAQTAGAGPRPALPGAKGPRFEWVAKPAAKNLARVYMTAKPFDPPPDPLPTTFPAGTTPLYVVFAFNGHPPEGTGVGREVHGPNGPVALNGFVLVTSFNNATGVLEIPLECEPKSGPLPDGAYQTKVTVNGEVVAVLNWSLGGPTEGAPKAEPTGSGSAAPKADAPAPVALDAEGVRKALSDGLKVTGTLTPERVTEGFNPQTTYRKWAADVRLENRSPVPVALGTDLLLIEVPAAGGEYDGFATFCRYGKVTDPDSYGLGRNHQHDGLIENTGGGQLRMSFVGKLGDSFGALPAGREWPLKRDFPQFTWVSDDARADLCVALPELTVRTAAGVERFRLLAYFGKGKGDRDLAFRESKLVRIEPAALKAMLAEPSSDAVHRVLAANWLAEAFPTDAPAPLAAAGARAREGQVLAATLLLLTRLKGAGLEPHALDLLKEAKGPNGIRSRAARYLGSVRHAPALEPLVAATADPDRVVADAAVAALGSFGGARAVEVLSGLLRNGLRQEHHSGAAFALAATRDPEAIKLLKDLATRGNESALSALAYTGIPETFDFFVRLAEAGPDGRSRDLVATGLKETGGEKALPPLLLLLARGAGARGDTSDGAVRAITDLNLPAATPKLAELAATGNARAARALADSQNDSVKGPLTELAKTAPTAVRRIALEGLTNRWATDSTDAFAAALAAPDKELVRAAIGGLDRGQSPRVVELLIPVLEHSDQELRSSAAWAVRSRPAGAGAAKLAAVLLRTKDPAVASALAPALVAAKWTDPSAIAPLGQKLAGTKGPERHELVKLLRHLSGDTIGPKDDGEWYKDPDGWCRKCVDWAGQQK